MSLAKQRSVLSSFNSMSQTNLQRSVNQKEQMRNLLEFIIV